MSQSVELVVHARHVLKVNPVPVKVLDHHSIVVDKGIIVDVLPTAEAKEKYKGKDEQDLKDHVLMPGMVNCHGHTPMTLFRGFADDLPLQTWLSDHIWPAEGKWLSAEFCATGTELAIAEMLRAGTTCFTDMYFWPDDSAAVAEKIGMRANIGAVVFMFPSAWAGAPKNYLIKAREMMKKWDNNDLISTSLALHAPYTVTDDQITGGVALAREYGVLTQMHVHETQGEVDDAVKASGERPMARLDRLGLLDDKFLAVHMTAVNDEDLATIVKTGVHVAHCPESNAKLASGICDVPQLLAAGVNVCLGTDGAASNNDLDMFGEMRTSAMLGKLTAKSAAAMPVETMLRMATINGAIALGLADKIGSLEKGKSADMAAIKLGAVEATPVYNLMSNLVWSMGRDSVTDVWIRGKQLLQDRKLTTMDEQDVIKRASALAAKVLESRKEKADEKEA